MVTGIDHLVILVNDLPTAMEDYGRLGFTVEYGGEHPGGTHNALIAFADGAYLELIAFQAPDQPHDHPWYRALDGGEGLVAFAMGVDDLAAEVTAIQARGLMVGPTVDGARKRPDGRQLVWKSAGLGDGPRGRQRPFLIEDVSPREWRVGSGWLARHAASVVSIVDITLAVSSLSGASNDLAALLGVARPETHEDDSGRSIVFPTARGAVRLIAPAAGSELAAAVERRGDHVSAATLGFRPQGGEPVFDQERLHGAALTRQPV